jgi:hypothetical protein
MGPRGDAFQPLRDRHRGPGIARSAARGPFRAGHDTESTLLGASDSAYRVVVTALRAMYGDQFGDYRPIANTMLALDAINRMLAEIGLLPSLTHRFGLTMSRDRRQHGQS